MDIRHAYAEMTRIAEEIDGEDAVVVSLETGDGGKAGIRTEVRRMVAARLIYEQKARLATEAEAAAYRAETIAAWRQAQEYQKAQRAQFAVLTAADLAMLRQALHPGQE